MSDAETSKSGKTNHSWYAATSNRLLKTLGGLTGEINCDICVIGAGFTGISAAYELCKRGYSVTLIEANSVASMASGRNGGHILRGYAKSPSELASHVGVADAKKICDFTLETIDLIKRRVEEHKIDCDLRFGHVTAGLNAKHVDALKEEVDEWAAIGHGDLKLLDEAATQAHVRGRGYIAGLYDPRGAQFHPVNYALALAQLAQDMGCKIYDQTPALEVVSGDPARVVTPDGVIRAKFVVFAGATDVQYRGAEAVGRKLIAGTAHMIATEPLGARADELIPSNVAAMDANFLMNYYRLSADKRMLFGGTCNYSGMEYPGQALIVKKRMTDVFPSLKDVKIDYFWGGTLDFTMNRLPHMGRTAPNVFFIRGFSGHGIVLSNMAGKLVADVIHGTAADFDIFSKIRHLPFAGGDLLKRPLFVAGMMWYRLRDYISNL